MRTAEVVAVGTLRLLDAIESCGLEKSVKFCQVCQFRIAFFREKSQEIEEGNVRENGHNTIDRYEI